MMDESRLEAIEKETAEENEAVYEKERKKIPQSSVALKDAEERLHQLLMKAKQYTEFLNRKLISVAASVAPSVSDDVNENGKRVSTTLNAKSKRVKSDKNQVVQHHEQPKLLTGGKLRDYQKSGYKWMVGLYENGLHGILADEMGLGKTVQTIALIAHLREHKVYGPFIIVVPLSTLSNWTSEITKWAPSVPTLQYHGTKAERAAMRTKYLKSSKSHSRNMKEFPVVLTTYEIVTRDRKDLQKCDFKYIIVDEGHRLKNFNCRLIKELNALSGGSVLQGGANKVLLTGTPLQNNLAELWSLLNFLMPEIFNSLEFFESVFNIENEHEDMNDGIVQRQSQILNKLHRILSPFMMRRLKTQVEKHLPVKKEIVIYIDMMKNQKHMYQSIVDGKLAALLEQATGERSTLNNVLMQLRKCSLHPYLHYEAVDDQTGIHTTTNELIECSGKMKMLDIMLTELKKQKRKVLIFSQFTSMLDIITDYFDYLRPNLKYCRIDGTTKLQERKEQMDEFNSHDSEHFVFLLSTRAGGVGINLVAADTVIIFDSDWNPHQDSQAQDRAHRIGQKKDVFVYRLITADSVELKILGVANSKRKLERIVCHEHSTIHNNSKAKQKNGLSADELKKLLENDFTGHVDEVGVITKSTMLQLLQPDNILQNKIPMKAAGYEVVEHRASSLVGGINDE